MSKYDHLSVRFQHVEGAGSVAVATILTPEFRDEAKGRKLGDELCALISTKPAAVVLNCSRVTYLTSSPIGQVVRAWKQSKTDEVRLVFTEMTEIVRGLFAVTRLDDQMEFADPEQSAISQLGLAGD